jgi:hypothetical protein
VKFIVLYIGEGLRLTICTCCSWEMALNVDLDASLDNMDWEEIWEKAGEVNSTKVCVINGEIFR